MIIMTHFPNTKIKGILLPRIRLLPIINLSSRIGIIEGMDHEELPIADLIWNMGFQDEGTAGWIGKMARLATISIWFFSRKTKRVVKARTGQITRFCSVDHVY